MASVQFRELAEGTCKTVADIFVELQSDPEGREKYQNFLEATRNKLRAIEYSLGQLAGKDVINEEDFAAALSTARRMMEECVAGGWKGFNRQGSGCFGAAVCLETTLRSITHSLGSYMIWSEVEEIEQDS